MNIKYLIYRLIGLKFFFLFKYIVLESLMIYVPESRSPGVSDINKFLPLSLSRLLTTLHRCTSMHLIRIQETNLLILIKCLNGFHWRC